MKLIRKLRAFYLNRLESVIKGHRHTFEPFYGITSFSLTRPEHNGRRWLRCSVCGEGAIEGTNIRANCRSMDAWMVQIIRENAAAGRAGREAPYPPVLA